MVYLLENLLLQGEGAGPGPTSSALISDLCSVLKGEYKLSLLVFLHRLRKKISKFNISKSLMFFLFKN